MLFRSDDGWKDWVKGDGVGGTTGQSKQMEAIKIKLVRNGNAAPVNTEELSKPDAKVTLSYKAHCEDYGWQKGVKQGNIAGTVGQAKQMEAIVIDLASNISGGIQYRTHVQDIGWMGWMSSGNVSGTTGQNKQVEAIQIQLTGNLARTYDVYYSAHSEDYGWLGWAKNGQIAGTTGMFKQMEAIKIVLVKKGDPAPGPNKDYSYTLNFRGAGWYVIGNSTYYYNQNNVRLIGWLRLNGKKYYLNPNNGGAKQGAGWA